MGLFKKKKSAEDWSSEGWKLIQEEKYEEAIECYDKALELESSDVDLISSIWNHKGTAFGGLGRYEESIRCSNKALEYNSSDLVALNNKAYVLLVLGRYEELINYPDTFCNELLGEEEHPSFIDIDLYNVGCFFAPLYKGFALENLKRYEEAMKCFDNALKVIFGDEEVYEWFKVHEIEPYDRCEEFALPSRDILHDLLKKAVENDKKITENIGISDEHRITPGWCFIIDLISLLTDLLNTDILMRTDFLNPIYTDGFYIEEKMLKLIQYFKEFNRAPRISGSLAIEFEDFINDESEDSSISSRKEEIMAVFEKWRELKLEGRL